MADLRHELEHWLTGCDGPANVFFVKRLSANDTGATGAHQVGVYVPNEVGRAAFPNLAWEERKNDTVPVAFRLASHEEGEHPAAFKRYHLKKNECRITRLGRRGIRPPLFDPENTGAVTVFCFVREDLSSDAGRIEVWLCRTPEEEAFVEEWFGRPVEPGGGFWATGLRIRDVHRHASRVEADARAKAETWPLPETWLERFPEPAELVEESVRLVPRERTPDERLVARRNAEFVLFSRVERAFVEKRLGRGFADADEFIGFANSILNRRRARSGLSLELHVEKILEEEGFVRGVHFEREPRVDDGRSRPDFLFPNAQRYADPSFPDDRLRMLAVKTTLKERWRQILDEARRIRPKHVLTLDEGLGSQLVSQMTRSGLCLVVPRPVVALYPKEWRRDLTPFGDFLQELRSLYLLPAG